MTEMEVVPLIIIVGFVLPLWILLHYISKWKANKSISAEDESYLGDLRVNAEKLENRLDAMERILDSEVPDWRQKLHDPI